MGFGMNNRDADFDTVHGSSIRRRVVLLCLAIAVLDGMDVPILGLALPALSRDWGLRPSDFVLPTALGLIGMGLGTSVLGLLGDRYGPRRILAGSALLFGIATAALSLANSIAMLAFLRLIAGIGLGGALPNALSLIAEHASLKRRTFWLASVGTAMQVGGVLAGLLGTFLLGPLGWRALMLIGGVLPILLCIPIFMLIPERLAPSAIAEADWERRYGADGRGVDGPSKPMIAKERVRFVDLFEPNERRLTAALWGSFAALYLGIYLIPTWLPSVLTGSGLSLETASLTLSAFNLAGIIGGLVMSLLIGHLGIRVPLIVVGTVGAVWALLPSLLLGRADAPQVLLVAVLGMQGLFAVATLVALVALTSQVYPARLRGTGTGAALAAARVGAVVASFVGAWIVATSGTSIFFVVIGVSLAVCALLCSLVPNRSAQP